MSRESALARGQAGAQAGMVDACVITRTTGETTGAGGVITPTTSTLYTGRCRVQFKPMQGSGTDVGEAYLLLVRREVQLPMSVTGLREGDRITITAAPLDADLVGKAYVVRDVESKTHLTARRVTVLEVTS